MTWSSGSVRPRDPWMRLRIGRVSRASRSLRRAASSRSPEQGFALHASTIAAAKSRAIESGVGSEAEIDALERALRAAKDGGYDWVTTPFFLALTLRTQPG